MKGLSEGGKQAAERIEKEIENRRRQTSKAKQEIKELQEQIKVLHTLVRRIMITSSVSAERNGHRATREASPIERVIIKIWITG